MKNPLLCIVTDTGAPEAAFLSLLTAEAVRVGFCPVLTDAEPADAYLIDGDSAAGRRFLTDPAEADRPRLTVSADDADASALHRPFSLPALTDALLTLRSQIVSVQSDIPAPSVPAKSPAFRLGSDHRSVLCGDKRFRVSQHEYRLLQCLLAHHGEPVSRAELAALLGQPSDSHMPDVYLCHLRRKLGPGPARALVTVRGRGYAIRF